MFLLIRLLCRLGSALAAETKAGGRRGKNYPAPHRANSIGSVYGVSLEPPSHPFPFLPSAHGFPLLRLFSIFPSAVPFLLLPTKNGQNLPLLLQQSLFGGYFQEPRSKYLPLQQGDRCHCRPPPSPLWHGGDTLCGGVPNPPPLPAELCVSLNNYSDESITIRPNSHSAELTQIILILCFYR